jgi:hypothetical protein
VRSHPAAAEPHEELPRCQSAPAVPPVLHDTVFRGRTSSVQYPSLYHTYTPFVGRLAPKHKRQNDNLQEVSAAIISQSYLQQQLEVGGARRLVGSVLPGGVQLSPQILLRSCCISCRRIQSFCQGVAFRCQSIALCSQDVPCMGDLLCLRLQQLDSALRVLQETAVDQACGVQEPSKLASCTLQNSGKQPSGPMHLQSSVPGCHCVVVMVKPVAARLGRCGAIVAPQHGLRRGKA